MEEKLDKLSVWLEDLVCGLVSFPDQIKIERTTDDMGTLFVVHTAEADRGKVIGKEGTIASAIRVVLRSSGRLLDVRASMKVNVPGSNFKPKDPEGN